MEMPGLGAHLGSLNNLLLISGLNFPGMAKDVGQVGRGFLSYKCQLDQNVMLSISWSRMQMYLVQHGCISLLYAQWQIQLRGRGLLGLCKFKRKLLSIKTGFERLAGRTPCF